MLLVIFIVRKQKSKSLKKENLDLEAKLDPLSRENLLNYNTEGGENDQVKRKSIDWLLKNKYNAKLSVPQIKPADQIIPPQEAVHIATFLSSDCPFLSF